VVENLIAVVALALVGRIRARLEQHPRQLDVAGDARCAVQGDLEPLAVVNERGVRVGTGREPARDLLGLAGDACAREIVAGERRIGVEQRTRAMAPMMDDNPTG